MRPSRGAALSRVARTAASVALMACAAQSGRPGPPAEREATVEQIKHLEAELARAVVARDAGALRRIESPGYVYTDADAKVSTRDEFIRDYEAGASTVRALRFDSLVVDVHSGVAIVRGILTVDRVDNGVTAAHSSRYTRVYLPCTTGWCAATGHSSMLHSAGERLPSDVETIAADALRWHAGPSAGAEVATVWGAPQLGAAGGERYRFRPGFTSPEHTHPFHERAVVISGTFVISRSGQIPQRLGPGAYFFVPAQVLHATACQSTAPCELYNEVIPASQQTAR